MTKVGYPDANGANANLLRLYTERNGLALASNLHFRGNLSNLNRDM